MGESVNQALHREVKEELGIIDFEPISMGHYVFESKREKELVYVHRCVYDGEVKPSQDELDGGRFWTKEEILKIWVKKCSLLILRMNTRSISCNRVYGYNP